MSIKDDLVEVAREALASKGHNLNPLMQVENIMSYAATDSKFSQVVTSQDPKVIAELKSQIRYICRLGLDTAKGKKLVYVRTRNAKNGNSWVAFPDISESYHATILILVRSDTVKNLVVQHTYEKYPVEYSGHLNEVPVIKPWMVKPSDRGEYTGCFVTLYMPDGSATGLPQTSYHHAEDIASTHKQFSKSAGTWNNHLLAMTAKSAIMDAVRYIPKMDEDVANMVSNYDESHDWEKEEDEEGGFISNEQVDVIEALINEINIPRNAFLSWLSNEKIAKSVVKIPTKHYDTVIAKLESKRPQEKQNAE